MSKFRKPKKLRRPNVPLAAGQAMAGGGEAAAEVRAARPESQQIAADYTHVKKDLARIGGLAAGFIALLVVLSFLIK